jgi:hypothetical protein
VDIWRNVNELVDRAETVTALHAHRMHLYAAWRWRGLGRPVPEELVEWERGAAVQRLGAPILLRHVREAYDGPMVLLKGAEVAARYPKPQLRPSLDLDLLVPDAKAVQKALLAGGFTERLVYQPGEGHHHLRGLEWPGVLMRVEVHSAPNWPTWLKPPPTEQLFEAAVSESVVGHGVLALPPAHHALIVTAHMWREVPLVRLGQLIDVRVLSLEADPDELERLAGQWGLRRIWKKTDEPARRLLDGEHRHGGAGRFRARRLETVSEVTVIEAKLAELSAPFRGLPPGSALVASSRELFSELRPDLGETWVEKLRRSAGALRQVSRSRAARDRELDEQQHISQFATKVSEEDTGG